MPDNSILSEAIIFVRSIVEEEEYSISKKKMDNLFALGEYSTISSVSLAVILVKELAREQGLTATEILDRIQYEIITASYEERD